MVLNGGCVSLLALMLAGVGVSSAARETLSVTEGGVTFTGVRYDDGRDKPYRLKFRQDGTRSLYMFNSAAQATNIKIGEAERYKVRRIHFPPSECLLMERIWNGVAMFTRFAYIHRIAPDERRNGCTLVRLPCTLYVEITVEVAFTPTL